VYVRNNPIKYTDPSGHFFLEVAIFSVLVGFSYVKHQSAADAKAPTINEGPAQLEQNWQRSVENRNPVDRGIYRNSETLRSKNASLADKTKAAVGNTAAAAGVAATTYSSVLGVATAGLELTSQAANLVEKTSSVQSSTAKIGQDHHVFTNKHSKYTSQFEETTSKYGLSLDDDWNIIPNMTNHSGRHTHAYHDDMLDRVSLIDNTANGDKTIFLNMMEVLKTDLINDPSLMYK